MNSRYGYLPEEERKHLCDYWYQISVDYGCGEYALAALLSPGAWAREPLHEKLPKITMPTIFVYGENDWMDRKHAEDAVSGMTVETKIISVPMAGHNLNVDNATFLNDLLVVEINK